MQVGCKLQCGIMCYGKCTNTHHYHIPNVPLMAHPGCWPLQSHSVLHSSMHSLQIRNDVAVGGSENDVAARADRGQELSGWLPYEKNRQTYNRSQQRYNKGQQPYKKSQQLQQCSKGQQPCNKGRQPCNKGQQPCNKGSAALQPHTPSRPS